MGMLNLSKRLVFSHSSVWDFHHCHLTCRTENSFRRGTHMAVARSCQRITSVGAIAKQRDHFSQPVSFNQLIIHCDSRRATWAFRGYQCCWLSTDTWMSYSYSLDNCDAKSLRKEKSGFLKEAVSLYPNRKEQHLSFFCGAWDKLCVL